MRPGPAVPARLPPTALIAWVLSAGASAQPVSLDERGLDGVTASTAGSTWPARLGVVIEGSAETSSRTVVTLEDRTQSDARALNLINAAGADSAQGVNIADRRAGAIDSDAAARVEQRNEIVQADTALAAVGEVAVPAAVVERRREVSGSATEASRSRSYVENVDRSRNWRRTTTRFEAEVEPEVIGLFDEPVSLGGHSIALPDFSIDFAPFDIDFSFGEDDLFDIDVFDEATSLTINIGSLKVHGASINLGEVVLEGNDIVILSPSLTVPDLTFSFCFVARGCDSGSDDSGSRVTVTVEGDTFGLEPIRLADANPLGDLGFSFGYAVAGDGTITFESGGVEFTGAIPLDLGLFDDLSFDLDVPGMSVFGGFLGSLELPTISIPVDLALDFPPGDVIHDIEGEACTFSNGQQQCSPIDRRVETVEESTRSSAESEITETSRTESHAHVEIERRRGELVVEEGQADHIVLRDSTLADKRYRLVIVSGEAQRGIRAVNAVNSATAIVGNGLNLGTERADARQSGAGIASSMSQTNSFHQVGGL